MNGRNKNDQLVPEGGSKHEGIRMNVFFMRVSHRLHVWTALACMYKDSSRSLVYLFKWNANCCLSYLQTLYFDYTQEEECYPFFLGIPVWLSSHSITKAWYLSLPLQNGVWCKHYHDILHCNIYNMYMCMYICP